MVTAVNGLKDARLRTELMPLEELDWNTLNRILTSRGSAEDSQTELNKPTDLGLNNSLKLEGRVDGVNLRDDRYSA